MVYAEPIAFERISIDHRIMAGVPCIRGTRIPVATVVGLVAEGVTIEEILASYPQLTGEDVDEVLRYAAAAVDQAPCLSKNLCEAPDRRVAPATSR